MTRNLVGIGTTDPQYTLDVSGDINVTGGLFSNGQDVSGALYWTETAGENVVTNTNVGIGITGEPLAPLHVNGNARIDGNLTVNGTQTILNTTVEETSRIEVTNNGTGPAIIVNQTGAQPIANFQDDGVSALFIADGGNVGIGITNPIGRLNVFTGITGLTSNVSGQQFGTISFCNNATARTDPSIVGKSSDTNPGPGLLLIGSSNDSTNQPSIRFNARSLTGTDFTSENMSSIAFDFSRFSTPLMTILRNGNVGIGITNPESRLQVNSNVGTLYEKNDNLSNNGVTIFGPARTAPTLTGTTDLYGTLFINSTNPYEGNRGASIALGGRGNNFSSGEQHMSYVRISGVQRPENTGFFGHLVFENLFNGSMFERMRITHDGDVGIGITNPIGRLNVFTGTSGEIFNMSSQTTGSISLCNSSLSNPRPIISSKSAQESGLGIVAGNNDDSLESSMFFDVRTGSNSNFTNLTAPGFQFRRLGTNLMTILRNGNVGIGITEPTQKLHVSGNAGMFILQGTGQSFMEYFTTSSQAGRAGYMGFGSGLNADFSIANERTGGNIVLITNNANRLSILNNGNVGIGTANPEYRLDVGANQLNNVDEIVRIRSRRFAGLRIEGDSENLSGEPGGAYVRLSQDGQTIVASMGLLQGNGQDGLGDTATGTIGNSLFIQHATDDQFSAIQFGTRKIARMTIANTGNVGIGITNPSESLHVNGSGSQGINLTTNDFNIENLSIKFGGPSVRKSGIITKPVSNWGRNSLNFCVNNEANATEVSLDDSKMTITNTGNVGIGTANPSSLLSVGGSGLSAWRTSIQGPNAGVYATHNDGFGMAIVSTSSAADRYVLECKSGTNDNLGNGGTTVFRVSANGNVGIGITNPSEKLHVTGNINISGQYRLNGSQLNTTNIPEGTNQYFTTQRARQSINDGSGSGFRTGISYDNVIGRISLADYAYQSVEKTVGVGWWRIAVQGPMVSNSATGGGRTSAFFIVQDTRSSNHGCVRFSVNQAFGAVSTINIESASSFGGTSFGSIQGVRTMRGGTNAGHAVEIYVGATSSPIQVRMLQNDWTPGYTIVNLDPGDVPSGFTGYEIDLTAGIVSGVFRDNTPISVCNRNLNFGIGVTNPSKTLDISGLTRDNVIETKTTSTEGHFEIRNNDHIKRFFVRDDDKVFGIYNADSGNARTQLRIKTGNTATDDVLELLPNNGKVGIGIGTASPTQLLSLGPNGAGFPAPSGSAPLYAARAWVNFIGNQMIGLPPPEGPVNIAIRASRNVTSVTRSATGNFTINLTTAAPNADYVVNITTGHNNTAFKDDQDHPDVYAMTSSSVSIFISDATNNSAQNSIRVMATFLW